MAATQGATTTRKNAPTAGWSQVTRDPPNMVAPVISATIAKTIPRMKRVMADLPRRNGPFTASAPNMGVIRILMTNG